MVTPLGEFFSGFLEQPKFHEVLNFLFMVMLSFSKTFQNDIKLASTPNIREVVIICNVGDKSALNRLRSLCVEFG